MARVESIPICLGYCSVLQYQGNWRRGEMTNSSPLLPFNGIHWCGCDGSSILVSAALPLRYESWRRPYLSRLTNLSSVLLMETEKDLQDPPAYSFEDGSPGASDVRTAGSSEGPIHFPEPLIPMPFASNPAWVPSPGEREPITGPPNTSTALVPGPNPIDANGALGDTAKTSRPNSSGM